MDEQVVTLLRNILTELQKVNEKLDTITDNGSYSIWDTCSKLDSVDSSISKVTSKMDTLIGLISER